MPIQDVGGRIMRFGCRGVGILVLVGVAAVAGYGQDNAQSRTTSDQQQTTAQTKTQDYEFPSDKERFNRYIKSTIGPFRLVQTGASAGIAQWRDSPHEWGQGMKGYGKRYASGLAQNAIHQTVTYGL